MGRGNLAWAAALVVAAAGLITAPIADAVERRDARVTSFDGTPILTHFFPAPTSAVGAGGRAPTVMLGHGWAGSGATKPEGAVTGRPAATYRSVGVAELLNAGYNVVTWDARGFGRSGGRAQIDSPAFEGRDVQHLIDWVAMQPEVQLDGAGDPRLGMTGASYGGAIQLVAAALDRRVDAITPSIAWHDLENALLPAGDFRFGWGSLLLSAGLLTGKPAPEMQRAYTATLASGRVAQRDYDWFFARGPGPLVAQITAPTLILQGTADTLFTLRDGIKNYEMLRGAGTPVRMVWFCGGHGICQTDEGPRGQVARATMDWLDRYLQGRAIDTGAPFTWVADDGRWRSAPAWPPAAAEPLRGTGQGRLGLRIGWASGALIAGTPHAGGMTVPIAAPVGAGVDVVGAPRLTLRYRGTAWPRRDTHVFAQIVHRRPSGTRKVVGGQVSPVAVVLDGREHTVTLDLEPIAARAEPGSQLALQLIGSSSLFDMQRTNGGLTVDAGVELPTAAAATPVPAGDPAPAGP